MTTILASVVLSIVMASVWMTVAVISDWICTIGRQPDSNDPSLWQMATFVASREYKNWRA